MMLQRIEGAIKQLRRVAGMRALYPAGHPIHASALEGAREAIDTLLDSNDRIDLLFTADEVVYEDEPLPDSDGSLGELAARWWDQGICGLSLRRGLTDEELALLIEMSRPADHNEELAPVAERLAQIEAQHVLVAEMDFSRFVPRSQVVSRLGSDGPDGQEIIRGLVASAQQRHRELTDEERRRVLALLGHPETLAETIQAGVFLESGVEDSASQDDLTRIEEPHVAGAAIAETIQLLAGMACDAYPDRRDHVFTQLAETVRRLDSQLVAFAFRAEVGSQIRDFDALTEIAARLTTEELVDVVCDRPDAVTSELSTVCRRLLERIASGKQKLLKLAPALRAGLIEHGMSEDVYSRTLSMVLQEMELEGDDEEHGKDGARLGIAPAARRKDEETRVARREAIEDRLERAFGPEAWADRATLSIELLRAARSDDACQRALADVRTAISHLTDHAKDKVGLEVGVSLAVLAKPDPSFPDECHSGARSLLAEIADERLIEVLAESLHEATGEDRQVTIRALSLAGEGGRETLLRLMREFGGPVIEDDVPAIVAALLDTEEESEAADMRLGQEIVAPDCRLAMSIVECLAERGSDAANRHLTFAVCRGDYGLRRAIVAAAGRKAARHLEVLGTALEDADTDISCAAATHLGASTDGRAGPYLLEHVKAFKLRDPRFLLRVASVRAIGELHYEDATETLKHVLEAKSWLGRDRNDELRAAAATALAAIDTRASLGAVATRARRERCPRIRELAALAAASLQASAEASDEDERVGRDAG